MAYLMLQDKVGQSSASSACDSQVVWCLTSFGSAHSPGL